MELIAIWNEYSGISSNLEYKIITIDTMINNRIYGLCLQVPKQYFTSNNNNVYRKCLLSLKSYTDTMKRISNVTDSVLNPKRTNVDNNEKNPINTKGNPIKLVTLNDLGKFLNSKYDNLMTPMGKIKLNFKVFDYSLPVALLKNFKMYNINIERDD